jgi:hypothetical protein
MTGNESWRKRAACLGAPIDLFFPSRFQTGSPYKEGKQFCEVCPVTAECLKLSELNIPTGDRYGLFGGLTPNERRSKRRVHLNAALWESDSWDEF